MSSSKANDNRKITIYDIAAEAGVSVLAVECTVAADRLTMAKPVPVLL